MKKNITVERELRSSGKLVEHQQNLLKRINNLAVSLMPEFEDRNQAMNALSMDNHSLMQLLCTIQMDQKTRASDEEMRKVRRHRENLEEFYRSLQELGGILRIDDVAVILGITQNAVNERVKMNQIIAFKKPGIYLFPVFQFTMSGLLPGFEEVMAAFDEDIHPLVRLEVLKVPISLGEEVYKNTIQIMLDGADPIELKLAIRAARQAGNHVAS